MRDVMMSPIELSSYVHEEINRKYWKPLKSYHAHEIMHLELLPFGHVMMYLLYDCVCVCCVHVCVCVCVCVLCDVVGAHAGVRYSGQC